MAVGTVGVVRKDVDGGWAWVVLVASFMSTAIIYGFSFNGGIYFVTFLNAFGQSRSYTALVYAVQVMAIHVGGPVSSLVLARYGPRTTMISGSLLVTFCLTTSYFAQSILMLVALFGFAGLGMIMVMASSLAVMSVYFDKHFSVATGITNSGAGIGMAGMGVLIEWAIAHFGWRGSMLIMAGVVLQSTLCGALFFRLERKLVPARIGDAIKADSSAIAVKRRREAILRTLWKDPRWYMVFANFLLFFFSWNIELLILKDSFLAKDLPGISYQSAIIGFGVANTLGRLTSGFLNDHLLDPPLQGFINSLIVAATILGAILVADQWLYAACVVIYAFFMGQLAVLQALSLAYVYGTEIMPILWGYGILAGVVCLGSVPTTGYLVDISGSYTSAHALAAMCIFASGIFTLLCYVIHRRTLKSQLGFVTCNANGIGGEGGDSESSPLAIINQPIAIIEPKFHQLESLNGDMIRKS